MRDTTQTCTVADQVRHEHRGAVVQSRAQQDVSHMLLICPFRARRFLPLKSEAGFVSGGYHVSVYIPPHLSCSTLWLIDSPLRPFWFAEVLHIFCILTIYCWALAGSVSCAWFRFCYPAGKQPCNPPRLSGPLNQSGGLEIPVKSWSTNLMEGSKGENKVLKVCLSASVWLQRMERLTQSAKEDWWRQEKGWWPFIVDHHFIWH